MHELRPGMRLKIERVDVIGPWLLRIHILNMHRASKNDTFESVSWANLQAAAETLRKARAAIMDAIWASYQRRGTSCTVPCGSGPWWVARELLPELARLYEVTYEDANKISRPYTDSNGVDHSAIVNFTVHLRAKGDTPTPSRKRLFTEITE